MGTLFALIVGVGGFAYLVCQIPAMIESKREIDRAQKSFDEWMNGMDAFMRDDRGDK